ncbi:hypothetical protein ACFWA6_19215 [Streptomyces sp. NPDC060020]|uniref:hypothetical protein n=1 Tax=unclassified Streptomyces TaxID=2593676 RepID=UPI00341D4A92
MRAGTRWWRYEIRRCGKQAAVLPLVAAALAYAAVGGTHGAGPGFAGGALLGRTLLSTALPAATALACAAVVVREPMTELHLTLPTPYARTLARRLAWPATVATASAVALLTAAVLAGLPLDPGGPVMLLQLLGLTALLSGSAVYVTVRSGSAAPATGLVVAAVLAKLLLVDRVLPEGLTQALPALLGGAVLAGMALRTVTPPNEAGPLLTRREPG